MATYFPNAETVRECAHCRLPVSLELNGGGPLWFPLLVPVTIEVTSGPSLFADYRLSEPGGARLVGGACRSRLVAGADHGTGRVPRRRGSRVGAVRCPGPSDPDCSEAVVVALPGTRGRYWWGATDLAHDGPDSNRRGAICVEEHRSDQSTIDYRKV